METEFDIHLNDSFYDTDWKIIIYY
jgi:hypothetical protein